MIFASFCQATVEDFLKTALKAYPNTLYAILSHPKLPDWYKSLAEELTRQEALNAAENKPFNAANELRIWAASFVEHCLEPNKEKYTKTIKKAVEVEATE